MSKLCLLFVLATLLLAAGCATDQGSREYVPGQGWVPAK
jgi:uncharacterized lipoprotein YajG